MRATEMRLGPVLGQGAQHQAYKD